jgi:hypothetical protein
MTAIHEQIPFVYSVINKIRRDAFLTYYRMKHPGASPTDIFTLYYNRNLFGDPESRSGTGSSLQATRNLRPELSATFERFGIESVLDVPCGDFNWMKALDWSRIRYLGGDIVEDMIRKNQAEHGSGNISFQVLDILQGNLRPRHLPGPFHPFRQPVDRHGAAPDRRKQTQTCRPHPVQCDQGQQGHPDRLLPARQSHGRPLQSSAAGACDQGHGLYRYLGQDPQLLDARELCRHLISGASDLRASDQTI